MKIWHKNEYVKPEKWHMELKMTASEFDIQYQILDGLHQSLTTRKLQFFMAPLGFFA